ncbi:hypothetical protein [Nocardia rhizosphaerae]|uniref:Minor tail protein n=1 Tax=Nocardia rhizosphaerae TaxID=1691571 RepID=A0ABV8L3U8_9NOCA
MADLPPLKYGRVVGRFLANIIDGPDIDDLPEFQPLTGTVTFTAEAPKILVASASPAPATYVQLPKHYVASLDEFGYLTWRGDRGLRLVAPSADTNPSEWTWRVTFDLSYDGDPVPIAPFSFEVPEYVPGPNPADPDTGSVGLVDLTLASPVPSSTGEAVVRGLSVVNVTISGNDLTFWLDNGTDLPPVTVPAIQDATDAAAAAAASESAAAASEAAAQAAVDSFDLSIGTVTEGPADATVSGGPPAWTLDLTLPPGPTGPAAPDADATTKGIIQLAGDLGGTASAPTVPALANMVDLTSDQTITGYKTMSTGAQIAGANIVPSTPGDTARVILDNESGQAYEFGCNSGDGFSVWDSTAGTGPIYIEPGSPTGSIYITPTGNAMSQQLDMGTSKITSSATPSAGDDLVNKTYADGKVASGDSPYDLNIFAFGKDTTRATGTGDYPVGVKLQRAAVFTSVTYRAVTADASGNLVVELRKNGVAVSGSSATITAANQVAGGTATGSWAFALGDILTVHITGVGTTPGKGLVADITGTA